MNSRRQSGQRYQSPLKNYQHHDRSRYFSSLRFSEGRTANTSAVNIMSKLNSSLLDSQPSRQHKLSSGLIAAKG